MPSSDIVADRLSRLEKVVNDISVKLDRVLNSKSPSSNYVPFSPVPQSRSRFFSENSEDGSQRLGATSGSWVRLYSKKRKEHFLYHSKTEKTIWESETLGASSTIGQTWEKISFCDHKGDLNHFYLDSGTGETSSREPPNLLAAQSDTTEFNPGYFDQSKFTESQQVPRRSFLKPTPSSMKRNNKRRDSRSSLQVHPEDVVAPEEKKVPCMFDPFSTSRTSWDLLIILPCLLYLTVMMPYRLCFADEAEGAMLIMETTMDMFFVLDLFINFRTGYFIPELGIVEYDPTKVAKEYLRTWFTLDLISGIPFGLFDMPMFDNLSFIKILKGSRMFKAFKLLRFIKLTRLFKLGKVVAGCSPRYMDWLEDKLHDVTTRSALSMLRIMTIISLVVHFMACLWVLIGRSEDINGRPNWLNNDIYTGDGEGFTHQDTMGGPKVKAIYISAYYYCYTTITSVGYGDIHPYNDNERLFCLALEALGGFMYAIIIAALTSIANITDTNKRAVEEKLDMVASYVKIKRFPDPLGRRVRRYYRHFFETKTAIDEEKILSDLPTGLRDEVSTFLISDLMSNVTLFKDLGPVSWSRILPLLRPVRFEQGDIICSQGEPCTESFVILEGECRAVTVVDPTLFSEAMMGNGAAKQGAIGKKSLLASSPSFSDHDSNMLPKSASKSALEQAARYFPSPNSLRRAGSSGPTGNMSNTSNASNMSKMKTERRTSSSSSLSPSKQGQVPPLTPTRVKPTRTGSNSGLDDEVKDNTDNTKAKSKSPTTKSRSSPRGIAGAMRRKSSEKIVPETPVVDPNHHIRILNPGAMINTLCLLDVWQKCLETVLCDGETETYAINSKDFLGIFNRNDAHLKEITEKCVLTSFHMYKAPHESHSRTPSEHGIPLYMYTDPEIEFRTEAYLKWKEAKREQFVKALKQYESEVAKANALNRAKALRTVVRMIRSRKGSKATLDSGSDVSSNSNSSLNSPSMQSKSIDTEFKSSDSVTNHAGLDKSNVGGSRRFQSIKDRDSEDMHDDDDSERSTSRSPSESVTSVTSSVSNSPSNQSSLLEVRTFSNEHAKKVILPHLSPTLKGSKGNHKGAAASHSGNVGDAGEQKSSSSKQTNNFMSSRQSSGNSLKKQAVKSLEIDET